MADLSQQPLTGSRESVASEQLEKRLLSKSAATTGNRGPSGSNRKGRFSAIVNTINPLPVLGKGFRRRKDSQEDVSISPSVKESPKSTTGFTAVASQIEDFEAKVPPAKERRTRSDSLSLMLLDPDAISESTQSMLRQSSAARESKNTSLESQQNRSLPTDTPVSSSRHREISHAEQKSGRYLSTGSKMGEGARDSRENTPRSRAETPVGQTHVTSEPRSARKKAKTLGNRGHYERRWKERRRPTQINTLLSLEELNIVVAIFMVALSLAEITGKALSSIGTTIFLAIGLNQWSHVHKLRKRRQERLRMRQLKKQSSRMWRRTNPMKRKDALVQDNT